MVIGDRVFVFRNVKVPRRDRSDSPRDQVLLDIPRGTLGEVIGLGTVPEKGHTRMIKVQVTGGLLNSQIFWLEGKILRLAY